MSDELPAFEPEEPTDFHGKVKHLLQTWVSEQEEAPVLIDVAVVVWEAITYGDDGEVYRQVNYSTLTENAGLASTAGLLSLGAKVLEADVGPEESS